MTDKTRRDYHKIVGKNLEHIAHLERQNAALQAKLDAVMLEYCPEEMTAEQLERWALHQRPVSSVRRSCDSFLEGGQMEWIAGRLPNRGEGWSWPVFDVTIDVDGRRTTIRAEVGWSERHAPDQWYRVDGGPLVDKVLAWKPLVEPFKG